MGGYRTIVADPQSRGRPETASRPGAEAAGVASKYRTIVADPPWRYKGSLPSPPFWRERQWRSDPPFKTLTAEDISALPVADLAARDAHLYLWTTNTHLEQSFSIVKSWGFTYSTLLSWCKKPRGLVASATFTICTEYVVFARRGSLASLTRLDRNWFEWPRSNTHSRKPEAFLDMVERVSPGPYLEMFARRQRLGWDTWGDEALNHVAVAGKAGWNG